MKNKGKHLKRIRRKKKENEKRKIMENEKREKNGICCNFRKKLNPNSIGIKCPFQPRESSVIQFR